MAQWDVDRHAQERAHGRATLRGLDSTARSSVRSGRFGRLFRWLPPAFETSSHRQELAVEKLLFDLANLMISNEFNERIDHEGKDTPDADLVTPEEEDENRLIPAGYTYLGQFIDHDITFDPASSLQKQNDPDTLENFRTPRLDLDSLYGRGPEDQPYLYQRPLRLKFSLGPDRGTNGQIRPDLIRAEDKTALIGDKRNDENKIVRQIHALFLQFHNKVFDDLALRFPDDDGQLLRFLEAQRIVRWCYQWIVLKDFLPKICRADVLGSVMPGNGKRIPKFEFYRPHSGEAYMPVEFAAAAYRFGHSMVRPSYALNSIVQSSAMFTSKIGIKRPFARIPVFVARANNDRDALNGFGEPLPEEWGIDWRFFFGEMPEAKQGVMQIPQPSYRIDTTLSDPLGALPEFVPSAPDPAAPPPISPFASLAFRNLLRGFRLGLPSGQAVARAMGLPPLNEEQLWLTKRVGDNPDPVPWPEGKALFDANRVRLAQRAPLWFYILKEAEVVEFGKRLGPVGSRIVAETIVGLAWHDHFSYLFQAPNWTPAVEGIGLDERLDMVKLIRYVG